MSREIAIQQSPPPPAYTFAEKQEMAKTVASSRFLQGVETPQAAMTLMMLCEADGLHPIEALRRYHIINNRPSMKADAMQAEFQRRGGDVEWIESTAEVCAAIFKHPKLCPKGLEIRTTLAELQARGVTNNPTYKKFPRQMLRARVISEGVRAVAPGVVLGIYTPEETVEFEPLPGPIEVKAKMVGDDLAEQFEKQTPREKAQERQRERTADRNAKERHQSPAEVAAEMKQHQHQQQQQEERREYMDALTSMCEGMNAEYAERCEAMGVTPTKRLVNEWQVENFLATWALANGVAKPDQINTGDKRDRVKVIAFLNRMFRKDPEKFTAIAASHLDEKLTEGVKEAEEATTPRAENATQDVALEVHGEGENTVTIERPAGAPWEEVASA